MTSRSLIVVLLSLHLFASECKAEASVIKQHISQKEIHSKDDGVFSWLSEQSGFFLHPSISQKAGDFVVESKIDESEILMVIPSSAIISTLEAEEENVEEESEEEESEEEESEDEEEDQTHSYGHICKLYDYLLYEFQLEEDSNYYPYLKHLVNMKNKQKSLTNQGNDMVMPSSWSHPGKRLITMINHSSPQEYMVKLLQKYINCLLDEDEHDDWFLADDLNFGKEESGKESESEDEGDEGKGDTEITAEGDEGKGDTETMSENLTEPPLSIKLPPSNRAYTLTKEELLWKTTLEMTIQHQVDRQFLVPLYDQVPHHHFDYNIIHQHDSDSGSIQVIATRILQAGDVLTRPSQTSLEESENGASSDKATMIGALRVFGHVQRYPHHWDLKTGLSFAYHGNGEITIDDNLIVISKDTDRHLNSDSVPSIEWIKGPTEQWQLDYLEEEVSRQLKLYEIEVIKSNETVPIPEWNQMNRYAHATWKAFSLAIVEGKKILEKRVNSKERSKEVSALEQDYLATFVKIETGPQAALAKNGTQKEDGDSDDSDNEGDECDPLKDCNFEQLEHIRGCKKLQHIPSTVRNASEWYLMRKSYVDVIGPEEASIKATTGSGFRVPYKVAHSPARGRGVFITTDVPKGSLIWTTQFTAWFDEGDQFRRFLAPLPDDMVCDLLLWCYTTINNLEKDVIGCDLDEGSLVNSYDNIGEYNAGSVYLKRLKLMSAMDSTMYSMRDIKAGEELVTAYDEFDSDNYKALGL